MQIEYKLNYYIFLSSVRNMNSVLQIKTSFFGKIDNIYYINSSNRKYRLDYSVIIILHSQTIIDGFAHQSNFKNLLLFVCIFGHNSQYQINVKHFSFKDYYFSSLKYPFLNFPELLL